MNGEINAVDANNGTTKYCQMLRQISNPISYRGMCDEENFDSDYIPTDDEMVTILILAFVFGLVGKQSSYVWGTLWHTLQTLKIKQIKAIQIN